MGLMKAASGSFKAVLADQWKEYFYCDSMGPDVLIARGKKRSSGRSSNIKGNDSIITNGSVISVNEGQCMIIVDQGKVVEFTAEPGEFIWNASTESSIFCGDLYDGLMGSWNNMKKRFNFGGNAGKEQRVYFINLKEILGNKFGTPSPIPFRVVDHNIGLDMDVSIRCNGEYSYRITDPILFYQNVSGNVTWEFTRSNLDSQLKAEFLTALQPAFAEISAQGIRYSSLPGYTQEIANAMNHALSSKWEKIRGICVASVAINSVTASSEDEATIKELQKSAVFRNPNMAAAHMVQAQAEAMKTAAGNRNGAMAGFMGLNMAQNAGGFQAASLYQMGQQPVNDADSDRWKCKCGTVNTGKFCTECGSTQGWVCSCGKINKGKFCSECGAKKPSNEPQYACDKCGWEPEDPKNPPKFCPECGDRFDASDIR